MNSVVVPAIRERKVQVLFVVPRYSVPSFSTALQCCQTFDQDFLSQKTNAARIYPFSISLAPQTEQRYWKAVSSIPAQGGSH